MRGNNMDWFKILKNEDEMNEPSSDDISFMQERLSEVVNKVGNIYGLELKKVDTESYYGHPAGIFFSPNAIVSYRFAIGFEQYGENTDGFTVDEKYANGDSMNLWVDWYLEQSPMHSMILQEWITGLPKEYQDVENARPIVTYPIAADNMSDTYGQHIGIHVKEVNPQIESLVIDTHKKYEEKYGKGGESSYSPLYPMAYSPEEDKNVTPEEAIPKDDWKDSLRGKE